MVWAVVSRKGGQKVGEEVCRERDGENKSGEGMRKGNQRVGTPHKGERRTAGEGTRQGGSESVPAGRIRGWGGGSAGGGNENETKQQEEDAGGGDGRGNAGGETLVIMYTNAQSIVGKVNELACTTNDLNPDLILLTETWCNSEITNAYLGYEVQPDLWIDRLDTGGGRGGGLLVYVKLGLQVVKMNVEPTLLQMCKFSVGDILVYLLYSGPPESVAEIAVAVKATEKNSVLLGVLNIPEIDWMQRTAHRRAMELLEAVNEGLMEQLVEFLTHLKGNTLVPLITNIPERVVEVTEEGRLGKSDHVLFAA